MARGLVDIPRKRRTRQHVIADLSVNYAERLALLCGFSVERPVHDYGIDLIVFTYDDQGWPEIGHVLIQLKATDHVQILADQQTIAVRVRRADLARWLREPFPVILILYDGSQDLAYWLYLQSYFERRRDLDLTAAGDSVTVRLQMSDRLDQDAFRRFARFRDDVLGQSEGVIRHHD